MLEVLFIWFLCAILTAVIFNAKGRNPVAGFFLGFLLGIFGLIIAACLPRVEGNIEAKKLSTGIAKACPFCAELVRLEAVVCKHCGRDLPPPEPEPEPDTEGTCIKCGSALRKGYAICHNCDHINA